MSNFVEQYVDLRMDTRATMSLDMFCIQCERHVDMCRVIFFWTIDTCLVDRHFVGFRQRMSINIDRPTLVSEDTNFL